MAALPGYDASAPVSRVPENGHHHGNHVAQSHQ